jgi:predicted Zn-ribbon and HTH transcriptional regulator
MTKKKYGMSKWKTVQCLRCDYSWSTKLERPKVCPQCKSYSWDAPGSNIHRKPKKE